MTMDAKSDEMVVKERWPDAFRHPSGTIWSHRGWATNYDIGDNWADARSKLKVEDGATNQPKDTHGLVVTWDAGTFVARIPEAGGVTGHGDTREAAIAMVEDNLHELLQWKAEESLAVAPSPTVEANTVEHEESEGND